ncbi:MAG: hypothetical protein ABIH23_18265 [bacterium]
MNKPNCYECKYRGSVPGDAHSCCRHPEAKAAHDDPMSALFAIFASVGRTDPQIGAVAAAKLGIKAQRYGIVSGWFNWPWSYDPVWLTSCNGFESTTL